MPRLSLSKIWLGEDFIFSTQSFKLWVEKNMSQESFQQCSRQQSLEDVKAWLSWKLSWDMLSFWNLSKEISLIETIIFEDYHYAYP